MKRLINQIRPRLVTALLRRAEALEKRGRHVAAVDFLHRWNARVPAPRIEVMLRDLRYRAFFHQDFGRPPEPWPPITTDTFPPAPAIPEVDKRQLSPELIRAAVFQRGSLIVRGLLPAADVSMMSDSVRQAYDAHDRHSADPSRQRHSRWFSPFEPPAESELSGDKERVWYRRTGAELAADSPRALENLISCFESNGIIDLVAGFLGERPALSVLKTSLREIPFDLDARNGWHQDGAFLGQDIRTLNVWVALTDCGIDAPSMDMVPRRLTSIVPTGTEGAEFDWSVSPQEIERACGPAGFTHLEFKAGDAIFFDEMNLHRTSTLPGMTRNRMAIEAWFFAPSCYPAAQLPLLV